MKSENVRVIVGPFFELNGGGRRICVGNPDKGKVKVSWLHYWTFGLPVELE
jgi:hypothetical protein